MKPKPLVVLKNFTVPMVMIVPWHRFPPVRHAQAVREDADQTRKFRLSRPGAHLRRVGFYRCASSDGRRRGGTNSASGVNLQWTRKPGISAGISGSKIGRCQVFGATLRLT